MRREHLAARKGLALARSPPSGLSRNCVPSVRRSPSRCWKATASTATAPRCPVAAGPRTARCCGRPPYRTETAPAPAPSLLPGAWQAELACPQLVKGTLPKRCFQHASGFALQARDERFLGPPAASWNRSSRERRKATRYHAILIMSGCQSLRMPARVAVSLIVALTIGRGGKVPRDAPALDTPREYEAAAEAEQFLDNPENFGVPSSDPDNP